MLKKKKKKDKNTSRSVVLPLVAEKFGHNSEIIYQCDYKIIKITIIGNLIKITKIRIWGKTIFFNYY